MTPGTTEELLSAIRDQASRVRAFGVERCGVFRSFARDQSTHRSDVDILIEFEPGKKP
jgi:uncharacterized protein